MGKTLTSCFISTDKYILDCVESDQELSQGVEEAVLLLDDRRLLDSCGDQAEVL